MERKIKYLLLFTGFAMLVVFFIFENLDGDIKGYGYWQFPLIKRHLASQWAMPYLTPGKCGGFLLAADTQSLIFTPYMLMSFLVPNLEWAVKITNFLLSILLWAGTYRWLEYFGIVNRTARIFAGLLFTACGYWVYHMTMIGQVWAAGLAYTPWIMVGMENILRGPLRLDRKYMLSALTLAGLFFLLINSGYYWLQVAVPLIGFRVLAECIWPQSQKLQQLKKLGIIAGIALYAVLLSWPRLGAINEFQLSKFPREKGVVNHYQVIGNVKVLLDKLWHSFFDGDIVANQVTEPQILGAMWDYNNFIGFMAVIPFILGLRKIKDLLPLKIFTGLLLAVIFQLALMRTTHVADLIRSLIPLYKSITWYWRGTPILCLMVIVFVARGYERILGHKKWGLFLAVILMALNLSEIMWANHRYFKLPDPPVSAIMVNSMDLPKPLKMHYTCCIDYIFGYGNSYPPQLSINAGEDFWHYSRNPAYYNMHDVRAMFDPKTPKGYYMEHPWPLWPKADKKEFDEFINFKQIVKPSAWLQFINKISLTAAGAYFICLFVLLFFCFS